MAGNIIPAIATTNAIVAGIIVLQALQILRGVHTIAGKGSGEGLRNVHLQRKATVPLYASAAVSPNEQCGSCRDTYALVLCDPARVTLAEVVRGVLGTGADAAADMTDDDGEAGGKERDVSVYEDKRLLADPDFDENMESTLESLNVTRGKFLTIVDEDGEWGTLAVAIGQLP